MFAYPVIVERPDLQRSDRRPADAATSHGVEGPKHAQLSALAATLNTAPTVQRLVAQRPTNRTGLPDQLKAGIEQLSGLSMDNVRVHRGSAKPAQLRAHAFAQGTDIHLAPGQEQHLPHEAWHVVQQAQGRVRPTLQMKRGLPVNDELHLEQEADVMGARAAQVTAFSAMPLQAVRDGGAPVIQGKFGVQVDIRPFDIEDEVDELDDVDHLDASAMVEEKTHKELRIFAAHIAGRPKGLFDDAERSHTAAWAVYTDQVRNAVLGCTLFDAIGAIKNLYTDAQNLPGVARVASLQGNAAIRYNAAKLAMDNLVAVNLEDVADLKKTDYLQQLIKGYLTYRNLVPLSQVNIGPATGHGEPDVLHNLRSINDFRTHWVDNLEHQGLKNLGENDRALVRTAMWSLLDTGAVIHLVGIQATPLTVPGLVGGEQANPTKPIAQIVLQHLWTVENAYENAFRESQMDSEESIRGYLKLVGCNQQAENLVYDEITQLYENAPDEKATQDNQERFRTGGPGQQGLFAIQINLAGNGTINELHVGSRAPTLLGSAQGSHSTAWVVYVDGVRGAVLGKDCKAAVLGMLELCAELKTLPGMKRVDNLTEHQRFWYESAAAQLIQAENAAKANLLSDIEIIPRLQRLIGAYLGFRNAVPLSQVKGGLADGNAEAQNRAIIRYAEGGFVEWTGKGGAPDHDKAIYRRAFWELYDYKQMFKAAQGDLSREDAPGLGKFEGAIPIVADSLKQHLIAMKRGYPTVYAWLAAESYDFLYYVIDKMGYVDEIADQIIELVQGK